MSETPAKPPQTTPSDQTRTTRGSQPRGATGKSHRGGNRRGPRKPADPAPAATSSTPNESSAPVLNTSLPATQAPSAPAPAKAPEPEITPKTDAQRNDRQSDRPRGRAPGRGRGRGRRPEQGGRTDSPADSAPTENPAPEATSVTQTEPAPNPEGTTDSRGPRPHGNFRHGRGGRPPRFGRGNSHARGRGRVDQQPSNNVTSNSSNATPDTSSISSSPVATPPNTHASLAPADETAAASASWSGTKSTMPGIQQAEEIGLDLWADRPADENMWKSEASEAPPEYAYAPAHSTLPAHPSLPARPSPYPERAHLPPHTRDIPPSPAPVETPQPPQTPPIQPPIQPPVDDSPTSIRRVGLAYALLGPGGSVQHVFTDAESPWVMLSNLPRTTRRHHVEALVAPFGTTRYIKVYAPKPNTQYLATARILFDRHEHARAAVSALQGQVIKRGPITARLDTDVGGGLDGTHIPGLPDSPTDTQPQAQSSLVASDPAAVVKSCTVKVSWLAPTSTVYVTYATSKFAIERLKELNGRTIWNRRLRMSPMFPDKEKGDNLEKAARESGGYMVKITGLMGSPDIDALRRFVRSNDVVVTPNYSFEIGLTRLREDLTDVAPLESFRLLPHRRDDFKLHALAQYTTPAAAANAVKIFEKRRSEYLGSSPVWVSRHLTVRYLITERLTEVLQGDINKLHSWAMDDPDLHVRQQDDPYKPGFIQLTLSGNDTKQLVAAKAQLDRALAGVPLTTPEGLKIWDKYFTTEDGSSFLESVAKSSNICARADKRTNSILLFGPGYARNDASKLLRDKLDTQKRLRRVLTIPKPVFRRLQAGGLTILRDLVGKGNIYVNIFTESLTFYGDDEVVRRVQKAIDVMYSEVGSRLPRHSDCVVCLCKPERALLFHCGHHYCRSCFSQYVASAAENRTLPLVCVGQDCKAPIPLSMITLHAEQPDQEALFYAAFQAHVAAHPDQYRYCPTPDCQYIYRVGPEDAVVQCRLCLTNICTHCHIESHEGIICADYKASHDESEIQKSFDRWRAAHNVKPCPTCAAPIEKIAGCNHMMCSACRGHMCWVCMSGFRTGDEVYEHMRSKHGGIGL